MCITYINTIHHCVYNKDKPSLVHVCLVQIGCLRNDIANKPVMSLVIMTRKHDSLCPRGTENSKAMCPPKRMW